MKTLMTTANVSVQISVKTEGNHTDSKQNILDDLKESEAVYRRTTFSLTDEINAVIDQITFIPSSMRATRSDVVKSAVLHLREMTSDEIECVLKKFKTAGGAA